MKLYFVRHAQSEGNAKGYLSTVDSDQLSSLGHEEAEGLVERLKAFSFDAIYVSSCRRTLQTVAPYLRATGQKGEVWSDLAEACWQADVDAPSPERTEPREHVRVPDDLRDLYVIPASQKLAPLGWETYREGSLRVEAARAEILKRHSGTEASVLVVGHFNSGARLLEYFMEIGHTYGNHRFHHENTGLSFLPQNDDGTFSVTFLNQL